jgi:hypothetical protein
MASDLSKFGVPLDGEKLGMLHPKQQYRFRVIFKNFGENQGNREMTQNIVSATRPKMSQAEVEMHSYNSVAYIPGKHSWEPVTIVLRDDITNAVISAVGSQIQKQINHYEQTSAVSGINQKFGLEIHTLDGTNNEQLESWDLDGCFIQNVSYPDGDMSSSEFNLVELTVRFDNATNVAGPNTNDGTTVGGNPMPNLPSPTGGTTFG